MEMQIRNAYELEDGRICVELYDGESQSWYSCVVDPNDNPTKDIWKAVKESGNYTSYQEWLSQNAERIATENAHHTILREIAALKFKLSNTDYQAIKFAEGELSAAEYSKVQKDRKSWRARINELEALL